MDSTLSILDVSSLRIQARSGRFAPLIELLLRILRLLRKPLSQSLAFGRIGFGLCAVFAHTPRSNDFQCALLETNRISHYPQSHDSKRDESCGYSDKFHAPQRRGNRGDAAGRPGRAADDEPRRLQGLAGLPWRLRLTDMLGGTVLIRVAGLPGMDSLRRRRWTECRG